MSSAAYPNTRVPGPDALAWTVGALTRPLQALIAAPALLFLITLVLMLFHPPDFHFHGFDRIAFGLLILVVLLRACLLRQPLHFGGSVAWPMLALLVLAFY